MKFNSQICTTREQSKKLLALGLKKETADMVYQSIGATPFNVWDQQEIEYDFYPAWSLHRLMILLDMGVEFNGRQLNMAYNDLIMFIEYKISIGYFNKDYLEEEQ